MSKLQIKLLTTEGDCEGRSTKNLGRFIGTNEQIIQYCVDNNIKPYYDFRIDDSEVIDVSGIKTNIIVTEGQWGKISYTLTEEDKKAVAINTAMSKVSKEDLIALGL